MFDYKHMRVALEKEAAPSLSAIRAGLGRLGSNLGQRSLAAGSLGAIGAGAGAGVGGLVGGIKGYAQAKEEGRSGLSGALSGGMSGATQGAAIGGIGGAAFGGLGGKATQGMMNTLNKRQGSVGALSRFGARQAHSVTGALPAGVSRGQGLRDIGASHVKQIQDQMRSAAEGAGDVGFLSKARGAITGALKGSDAKAKYLADAAKKSTAQSDKHLKSLSKALTEAEKAEEMGLTNVPGLFKSMVTRPGETAKTLVKKDWYGSPSAAGKAMTFGMPAAFLASDLASKPRDEDKGDTLSGRALGGLGTAAAYMTPMGMAGQAAAAGLLGKGGKVMGNLVGKRDRRPAGNEPEVDGGESAGAERVYSSRVTGDFS